MEKMDLLNLNENEDLAGDVDPEAAASMEVDPPWITVCLPEPKSCRKANPLKNKSVKDFAIDPSTLFPSLEENELMTLFPSLEPSEGAANMKEECLDNAFVNAAITASQRSFTENNAPTFSTSDDPRLDFFFGVMEQTQEDGVEGLLKNSWKAAPLDTLKLLANLRDIRGGKGIRLQYQQCLYFLYQHHPKTLYENLELLIKFGYWKDILHFLMIIQFDGFIHPYFRSDAFPKTSTKAPFNKYKSSERWKLKRLRKRPLPSNSTDKCRKQREYIIEKLENSLAKNRKASASEVAIISQKDLYNQRILLHYKVDAKISSHKMNLLRTQFARESFTNNRKYRAFHLKIAEIFANRLMTDLAELQKDGTAKKDISLAGKWAPTLEGHFDRYTLIGTSIALQIVKLIEEKSQRMEELMSKSIPVVTFLARKVYNKEYCIPLRHYLEIPEHLMSTNKWEEINYNRVPAKCMKRSKTSFIKHDKVRFTTHVESKVGKVAGASLKPVEIICEAMSLNCEKPGIDQKVVQKQWQSLVDNIKNRGKSLLKGAVSVCDVSSSMERVPMKAAIGLTLLTMEMSQPPWNSICITFSEKPAIFNLHPSLELGDKLKAMKAMPWGGNTNLHAVFELIVQLGKKKKLKQEQMPEVLFIFTDMEFDEAFEDCSDENSEKTNFEAAKELFKDAGYQMPAVVFWNLRAGEGINKSTPVQKNELGVSLLSGFSGQMLSMVMGGEDLPNCSPLKFLMDVLEKKEFDGLVVYD